MPPSCYQMPIAIIGMACRLPAALDLDGYWDLLIHARSAISEIPDSRADMPLYYDPHPNIPGRLSSRLGGFLPPHAWGEAVSFLTADVRDSADPAHLEFCDVAGDALYHAGYDPFDLPDQRVAVYVGHDRPSTNFGDGALTAYAFELGEQLQSALREVEGTAEAARIVQPFQQRLRERFEKSGRRTSGRDTGEIAGFTSRMFGLEGPSQGVNSACAASLQSVALGVRSLQSGEARLAIAGGAAFWQPDTASEFSKAGAHSAIGSRPFDDAADGVICSEGYGAVVLKPLAAAVRDGDRIRGVISGVGAASDGRGKGIWAPQKIGQKLAIRRAHGSAERLAHVQHVEAHATSTPLGDATEVNALGEVFADVLPPGKNIPVTSGKANIGHTMENAGIAGLIKTVLSMQRTEIPPQIHFQTPNSRVNWESLPLYVPTRRTPWPSPGKGLPRVAGVNAFGFGGYNMHIALEEYLGPTVAQVSVGTDIPPGNVAVPSETEEDRIAIIGRGCLLPGADNISEFSHLLFQAIEQHEGEHPEVSYGNLDQFQYDWRRHKIPPKQLAQEDPLHLYLLESVDQALAESGVLARESDRERIGTLVESEMSGDFTDHAQIGLRLPELDRELDSILQAEAIPDIRRSEIREHFKRLCLAKWPQIVDETGSFHHSSLASRIVRSLDTHGYTCVIENATCSTSSVIAAAGQLLWSGDCDTVICAAGWRHRGPSGQEPQKNRLSAGAMALILKRHADCEQSGVPVLCTISPSELRKPRHSGPAQTLFPMSADPVFQSFMNYLCDSVLVTSRTG